MIPFKCVCGATVQAPDQFAGKTGQCPRCGALTQIPLPGSGNAIIPEVQTDAPARPSDTPSSRVPATGAVSRPLAGWKCANCERHAGKLEEAFEFEGNIVCAECHKRLSPTRSTAFVRPPVQLRPSTTVPFSFRNLLSTRMIFGALVLVCFVIGGAGLFWVARYVSHELAQQPSPVFGRPSVEARPAPMQSPLPSRSARPTGAMAARGPHISALSRSLLQAEFLGVDQSDYGYVLRFSLTNTSGNRIRTVQGVLHIYDESGRHVHGLSVKHDDPILVGQVAPKSADWLGADLRMIKLLRSGQGRIQFETKRVDYSDGRQQTF